MKKEIKIFFTALMFFTRIPCPSWVGHSQEYMNKAARYYPVIGYIVGGIGGLIYWGAKYILPVDIAILLSMTATIWITGAFHEDGFADVCDGFGGGWTQERILTIMKDSRIGTYGSVGLILILALKFLLLSHVDSHMLIYVLIAGHVLSRYFSTSMLISHQYVRENEDAKAKPLAKQMSWGAFLFASLISFSTYFLFNDWILMLSAFVAMIIVKGLLARYFKKWIGGYTGDCLGTVQQVTEIVFYLIVIIQPWKYIA